MGGSSDDRLICEIEALLRRVSIIIRKRGRDILADFDITPPQFNALLALDEAGAITMGELCERMYLACSTATDLIDRMERNGLITRERDPNDRRVIRLKVRDKGKSIIEEVLKARRTYLAGIMSQVPDDEKEQLIHSLNRVYTLMTEGQLSASAQGQTAAPGAAKAP